MIENINFCCPKCRKIRQVQASFGRYIDEFDFGCTCGLSFKYQYGNVSYKNEMSMYKNTYINEILDGVREINNNKYRSK